MRSLTVSTLAAVFLCGAVPLAAAQNGGETTKGIQMPNAVEKVRRELGKKITLDFSSQNFLDAIDHLRQKTKLNITLDRTATMMAGIQMGFDNQPTPVHLKSDNEPLQRTLHRMLSPYGLTYVILYDRIYISTERRAFSRQLQQGVTVNVDNQLLGAALRDLARETGANLVIDLSSEPLAAVAKVSLKLEDTTLETAVRLLSEMGGLKMVQVGNVMLVADPKKAAGIRLENLENPQTNQNQGYFPPMIGGFGGFGGGVQPALPPGVNPAQIKKAPPQKEAGAPVPPQR